MRNYSQNLMKLAVGLTILIGVLIILLTNEKSFKMKLHESLVDNLLDKNEYLDMKAQYDEQQAAAEQNVLRLGKELQTAIYSVSNECG